MGSLSEQNPSLWVGTTDGTDYPALPGELRAEVVIIGAGVTGLTAARLLVEDGASVIVLEAGRICSGATGYTTAKITSLHGLIYTEIADKFDEERAQLYGAANQAAIETVARLVAEDEIDCQFERRPHIAYSTDAGSVDKIRREVEIAQRIGLPATFEVPGELPYDVAGAVRFDDQAQFHPSCVCLALAAAVTTQGGQIFEHTRARHVDGDERVVVTEHGEVRANAIVVATHLPFKEMGGYFARAEATLLRHDRHSRRRPPRRHVHQRRLSDAVLADIGGVPDRGR